MSYSEVKNSRKKVAAVAINQASGKSVQKAKTSHDSPEAATGGVL